MSDSWTAQSMFSSLPGSPFVHPGPAPMDVRVVVENNNEEVWFIDDSDHSATSQTLFDVDCGARVARETATEGSAPTTNQQKKRKIDEISTIASPEHSVSLTFDAPSLNVWEAMDGSDETVENSLEDEEEMMDTVWTVLRPYKYAEVRRDRRHRLRIVKVPKNDLRREYLSMFCTVVNSHDPMLLRSFFRQYCLPTVTHHRLSYNGTCLIRTGASNVIKVEGLTEDNADCQLQRFGQPDAFALWAVKFDLNPDHCCTFSNTKVITTRSSSTVRLEADFVIHRTEIYDVSTEKLRYLWLQKVLSTYYAGESYDEYTAKLRSSPSHGFDASDMVVRHNGLYPLPLSQQPQLFTVSGRVVLNINEDRQIESIWFHPMLLESDPVKL